MYKGRAKSELFFPSSNLLKTIIVSVIKLVLVVGGIDVNTPRVLWPNRNGVITIATFVSKDLWKD